MLDRPGLTSKKVAIACVLGLILAGGIFLRAFRRLADAPISVSVVSGIAIALFVGVMLWHARRQRSDDRYERSFRLAEKLDRDARHR